LAADGTTVLGTCDPATGDCTCTNQFNYDCRATVEAPGTPNIATDCSYCNEAGTYYCDPASATETTGTCFCKEQYHKDDCSELRFTVDCKTDGAYFTFVPYSDFTDYIAYVKSADPSCSDDTCDNPACLLTDGGSGTWVYNDYPYTSAPAGATATCPVPFFVAGVGGADPILSKDHYKWIVKIDYSPGMDTADDQEVTVTCVTPEEGVATSLGDVQFSSTVDVTPIETTVTGNVDSGVTMEIQQGGNALSGGAVALGNDIDIVFTFVVGASQDFTVLTLVIANYPSSAGTTPTAADGGRAVKLLDQACVHKEATDITTGLTKTDNAANANEAGTEVYITYSMKVFTFDVQAAGYTATSDPVVPVGTVYVWADICLGTCQRTPDGDCSGVTDAIERDYIKDIIAITGPDTDARRRRRSSDHEPVEEGSRINLNVSFVVIDPRRQTGPVPHHLSIGSSDCYQSAAFLLPLILMGVVLVLSVISTLYFFSKVTRSKRGLEEGHTNMAYK